MVAAADDAGEIDLTNSVVVIPESSSTPVHKAVSKSSKS